MAQAALKHDYEGPVHGTMPMTSGHAGEHHIDDGRQIDLVHLARQTLGDVELEREVLSLFVVQSQVYLLRLQAAENAADWKRAAHTLKGSARGIGAWQLAEAAEAAEALAWLEALSGIDRGHGELPAVVHAVAARALAPINRMLELSR